jgi:peptidoglycan/xylan/chitin deacetylase (PgdA/CDA1 family)
MSRFEHLKISVLILLGGLVILDFFLGVSPLIFAIPVIIFIAIASAGAFIMSWQLFVPVRYKGESGHKGIALTFDDGPIAGKTEKVLKILNDRKLTAAFFCIGNRVAQNPDLLRRINDEGHLVGNHTFTHTPAFDFASASKVTRELSDTDAMIEEILEKKPRFFRPPYGVTNPMIGRAVKTGKYTVVGWSIRSFDTIIKDPAKLFKRTARSLEEGDIILFHDFSDSMLAILPDFLDHVEKKGLKIVRLDELLNEKPYR